MSQILRLEYTCSIAELEEAKSLHLRKQLGGGSRWRTNLVLVASLAAMLLGAWFRFRQIPEGRRALLIASCVGSGVLFVFWKRRFRKADPRPTQLEISERDLTFMTAGSQVRLPWSTFGECLESPDLFVLMDRPGRTLIVVPKRAFPSETWQTWFREQATSAPSVMTPERSEPPVPAPATPGDHVTLTVRPRFRDSLACTVASWRTWGVCLFVVGLIVATFLHSVANPRPAAVISAPRVFLFFVIPFLLLSVATIVMIFSINSWRLGTKYAGPQEFAFSEQSVVVSDRDGRGTLPWTSFEHYKETPWSFILWRGPHWILLPKRAFTSWDDLNRCRDLLDRHLEHSRWFVG